MNRIEIQRHLAQAERHVARGEQHLASQRAIVAQLQQQGRDAAAAIQLLRTFERSQALHVADRDRLYAALA